MESSKNNLREELSPSNPILDGSQGTGKWQSQGKKNAFQSTTFIKSLRKSTSRWYFFCLEGFSLQSFRNYITWKFFFFFFFLSFVFLGPHLWCMEVSRLGIELEQQLLAYTTATAMQDPSHICDLHHTSRQRWILHSLSKARDWTLLSHDGNSEDSFKKIFI